MLKINHMILALIIALSGSMSAFGEENSDWVYTVRPNDTIWDLCQWYGKDADCWQKLIKYNKLANPKYLPPGTHIRIPKHMLKDHSSSAIVVAVTGDVQHRQDINTGALSVGDKVYAAGFIKTGTGSATLEFNDGSRILIKPSTEVTLRNLSYFKRHDITDTQIDLKKGRVRADVNKANTDSRFHVKTPAAVTAVRGTDFRVYSSGETKTIMLTELLEGVVNVSNTFNERHLTAGFAVRAEYGKPIEEPVALLPRPDLPINKSKTFSFPLVLDWTSLVGAVKYKAVVFKGDKQILEQTLNKPTLTISEVLQGEYLLIIRGIDVNGFEGKDRKIKLDFKAVNNSSKVPNEKEAISKELNSVIDSTSNKVHSLNNDDKSNS